MVYISLARFMNNTVYPFLHIDVNDAVTRYYGVRIEDGKVVRVTDTVTNNNISPVQRPGGSAVGAAMSVIEGDNNGESSSEQSSTITCKGTEDVSKVDRNDHSHKFQSIHEEQSSDTMENVQIKVQPKRAGKRSSRSNPSPRKLSAAEKDAAMWDAWSALSEGKNEAIVAGGEVLQAWLIRYRAWIRDHSSAPEVLENPEMFRLPDFITDEIEGYNDEDYQFADGDDMEIDDTDHGRIIYFHDPGAPIDQTPLVATVKSNGIKVRDFAHEPTSFLVSINSAGVPSVTDIRAPSLFNQVNAIRAFDAVRYFIKSTGLYVPLGFFVSKTATFKLVECGWISEYELDWADAKAHYYIGKAIVQQSSSRWIPQDVPLLSALERAANAKKIQGMFDAIADKPVFRNQITWVDAEKNKIDKPEIEIPSHTIASFYSSPEFSVSGSKGGNGALQASKSGISDASVKSHLEKVYHTMFHPMERPLHPPAPAKEASEASTIVSPSPPVTQGLKRSREHFVEDETITNSSSTPEDSSPSATKKLKRVGEAMPTPPTPTPSIRPRACQLRRTETFASLTSSTARPQKASSPRSPPRGQPASSSTAQTSRISSAGSPSRRQIAPLPKTPRRKQVNHSPVSERDTTTDIASPAVTSASSSKKRSVDDDISVSDSAPASLPSPPKRARGGETMPERWMRKKGHMAEIYGARMIARVAAACSPEGTSQDSSAPVTPADSQEDDGIVILDASAVSPSLVQMEKVKEREVVNKVANKPSTSASHAANVDLKRASPLRRHETFVMNGEILFRTSDVFDS